MTETQPDRRDSSVRSALLHRPPAAPRALVRHELLAVLESDLGGAATLVMAPAGHGKSVLVSQWCERTVLPTVWISLPAPTDGLRNFLQYVAAGVRSIFPGSLRATARLVDEGAEPAEGVALTTLSNDLDDLPDRLVVVLDDYHVISSGAVHGLMADLLRHPATCAHFVVVSRRDPPRPIGALRAGGHLSELRMSDLRVTSDQSAEFVGAELGRELDARERAALDEPTRSSETDAEPEINSDTITSVESYVPAHSGDNFMASRHCRTGQTRRPRHTRGRDLRHLHVPPAGLAVYHLGNNGTAQVQMHHWTLT